MMVVFDHQDLALGTDAGIDNGKVYAASWKIRVGAADPETRFRWPLRGNVVREIDDSGCGEAFQDDALHYGRERAFVSEVGRNGNDARGLHELQRQPVEVPVGIAEHLADHGQPFEVMADIKLPAHAHGAMQLYCFLADEFSGSANLIFYGTDGAFGLVRVTGICHRRP